MSTDALRKLLRDVFPSNERLVVFLSVSAYPRRKELLDAVDAKTPRSEFLKNAVDEIFAHGLHRDAFFFDQLRQSFPLKRGEIDRVEAECLSSVSEDSKDHESGAVGSKALLRLLLPFEEGDVLIGRKPELSSVMAIVESRGFRFGVIWGRSGCGKTSLIRAGIVPRLKKALFVPHYIDHLTDENLQDLQVKIQNWTTDSAASPSSRPIVVVIDQLEEFFLRKKDTEDYKALGKLIETAVLSKKQRISFIVGIREDFLGKLHYLKSNAIPDPTNPVHCYELLELAATVADEILTASLDRDGTEFSEELIKEIVGDLTVDAMVRPVELQIVATTLKNRRIKDKTGYQTFDGASGLLRSYIKDEIARCPDREIAAFVLKKMCAPGRPVKSPDNITEDQLADAAISAGLKIGENRSILKETLTRLTRAHLIVELGEKMYNLVHDYLAPLVTLATAGIETAKEQANRLLVKYTAEYIEDKSFRMPLRHLWIIFRHADRIRLSDPATQKLYRKSISATFGWVLAPTAVIVGFLIPIAYAVLLSTYYLSTDKAKLEGAGLSIVVKTGHPWLSVLPGFDNIVVETDYTMYDVDDAAGMYEIPRDFLVEFQRLSNGGYDLWADTLAGQLKSTSGTTALRLLGNFHTALEEVEQRLGEDSNYYSGEALGLAGATLDPDQQWQLAQRLNLLLNETNNSISSKELATAIGLLELDSGEPKVAQGISQRILQEYVREKREQPATLKREAALQILASLIWVTPNTPTKDDIASLAIISSDFSNSLESEPAQRILETVALASEDNAKSILTDFLPNYAEGLSDPMPHLAKRLPLIAGIYSSIITRQTLSPLIDAIQAKPDRSAVALYGLLASRNRDAIDVGALRSIEACALSKAYIDLDKRKVGECLLALARLNKSDPDTMRAVVFLPNGPDFLSLPDSMGYVALTSPSLFSYIPSRTTLLKQFFGYMCGPRYPKGTSYYSGSYYSNLYKVAIANSDILDDDAMSHLLDDKCRGMLAIDSATLTNWRLVARLKPNLFLAKETILRDKTSVGLFDDPRDMLVETLALASYQLNRIEHKVTLEQIARQIETREDAEQRAFGAYAAFWLWVDEKSMRKSIESKLDELAKRSEAEIRMAANRAREMIWIAELTLPELNASSLGIARARLNALSSFPSGGHITAATRTVIEKWIEANSQTEGDD